MTGTSKISSQPGRLTLAFGLPAAAAAVVAGILLLPLTHQLGLRVLGYTLCCVIPFALVSLQRREATRDQSERGVGRGAWERWLITAILVTGLVISSLYAWTIAWELS